MPSFLGGGLAFLVAFCLDVKLRKTAGDINKRLRSNGTDEYAVVAKSIAPTFKRKSVMKAIGR